MILELGGGRELKLPDDMDEEIARQLGKLILATEQRAADAEKGMQSLREEVQALRTKTDTPAPQIDLSSIVTVIKEGQMRLEKLMTDLIKVESADRVLVEDDLGMSRSRVVK